jgi:hypothetical protein
MRAALRRVGADLRQRRHVDAYVVAIAALAFAVLSLFADLVSENVRWAVLLAGMGLLIYQITVPERTLAEADDLLLDRTTYETTPLATRIRPAREVWVFAPSGINLLTPDNTALLRNHPLAHPEGVVKVVVLDPDATAAVEIARRHLDDSLDYPGQVMNPSLDAVLSRLRAMAKWKTAGTYEHRLLGFNPGFSLLAINPSDRDGLVLVEMHGFHNESNVSRMHIELTRERSPRWYAYWVDQFDHIWQSARPDA